MLSREGELSFAHANDWNGGAIRSRVRVSALSVTRNRTRHPSLAGKEESYAFTGKPARSAIRPSAPFTMTSSWLFGW